jgi:hypothetical protein
MLCVLVAKVCLLYPAGDPYRRGYQLSVDGWYGPSDSSIQSGLGLFVPRCGRMLFFSSAFELLVLIQCREAASQIWLSKLPLRSIVHSWNSSVARHDLESRLAISQDKALRKVGLPMPDYEAENGEALKRQCDHYSARSALLRGHRPKLRVRCTQPAYRPRQGHKVVPSRRRLPLPSTARLCRSLSPEGLSGARSHATQPGSCRQRTSTSLRGKNATP